MATVTATVFGIYNHGSKRGQTNPKQSVSVTLYDINRKKVVDKLKSEFGSCFYQINEITD